jgi:hypothetical protein
MTRDEAYALYRSIHASVRRILRADYAGLQPVRPVARDNGREYYRNEAEVGSA